ncbi:prepilin-type N-terminal cleavage/methylation domain-containing protein [Candidatus Sumerlaeota bacterium]|nr:prepilin-type N-terminal cleavage/methylation domain-containing protein [Candidatus Sumerlaeota bacterium]
MHADKKTGFTLIELLIVVAIIAILAAIAVPNFLEAQVRSKVTRAKADMRTLVTALEAYYVDNNAYPYPAKDDGLNAVPPFTEPHMPEGLIPDLITTPIAYVTDRLHEPFSLDANDPEYHIPFFHFYTREFQIVHDGDPDEFDEYMEGLLGVPNKSLQYFVLSHGPDMRDEIESTKISYDPTNGTNSRGDIVYLGSGKGFTR